MEGGAKDLVFMPGDQLTIADLERFLNHCTRREGDKLIVTAPLRCKRVEKPSAPSTSPSAGLYFFPPQ